jgi:membrane protein YqaA with SNARE-associated domain
VLGLALLFSVGAHVATKGAGGEFWRRAGYIGVLALSFAGASSVVIPIPYTVILLSIASAFNPLFFAASVGAGSALGEIIGYALGYAGRTVVSTERRRQLDAVARIFQRFGAIAIFIFAFTPLPDDLLFIPLGLMRYSLIKALVACFLGKFCMALVLVFFSGVLGETMALDWSATLLTSLALAAIVVLLLRVNWSELAKRWTRPA